MSGVITIRVQQIICQPVIYQTSHLNFKNFFPSSSSCQALLDPQEKGRGMVSRDMWQGILSILIIVSSLTQGLGTDFAHCCRRRNLALQMDLRTHKSNSSFMPISPASVLKIQIQIWILNLAKKLDIFSEIQVNGNLRFKKKTQIFELSNKLKEYFIIKHVFCQGQSDRNN